VLNLLEVIMSRRAIKPTGLPIIHDRAAGIDIGSRFHVVGVPPELCDEAVQTFQAFTGDIERMAEWLVSIGIKTVAMESTGVYWVPVFDVLRSHGIEAIVANAREARAVPGRKSDVNDAQWLQRLHACGLLRPSFRPDRNIAALRAYTYPQPTIKTLASTPGSIFGRRGGSRLDRRRQTHSPVGPDTHRAAAQTAAHGLARAPMRKGSVDECQRHPTL
jgi:hypothetical protein